MHPYESKLLTTARSPEPSNGRDSRDERPATEIESSMQALEATVKALIVATDGLAGKVNPILMPSAPMPSKCTETAKRPVPLAARIQDQTDTLAGLLSTLTDLAERIEL